MPSDKTVFWHLTENPNWKLDTAYRPLSAYGVSRPMVTPGLFVTDNPLYWSSWMGKGPIYAIRVHVPEESLPRPTYHHPEYFISNFAGVQVREIRSLAEAIARGKEERRRGIPWWNQQYGGFGGVEDWWFYQKSDDELGEREGLDELKEAWKREHPGFKDPREYYR